MRNQRRAVIAAAFILWGTAPALADVVIDNRPPSPATATARPASVASVLNDAVNAALQGQGLSPRDATKVVPIVTTGGVAYGGMAQVEGPAAAVARVRAVFSYKGAYGGGAWTLQTLVPIDSLEPGAASTGSPASAFRPW